MSWITALEKREGRRVRLVSASGHKHWGFIVGEVYEIRDGRFYGKFDRFENALANQHGAGPTVNWGEWEFTRARSIQLENK